MVKMFTSAIAIATLALAASVNAVCSDDSCDYDIDTGYYCCQQGLDHCQIDQGDWGCVQIDGGGPNCVDQTMECDDACLANDLIYAYQRTRSDDYTCICTNVDASMPDPNEYCIPG